jgi:hypothetical protein
VRSVERLLGAGIARFLLRLLLELVVHVWLLRSIVLIRCGLQFVQLLGHVGLKALLRLLVRHLFVQACVPHMLLLALRNGSFARRVLLHEGLVQLHCVDSVQKLLKWAQIDLLLRNSAHLRHVHLHKASFLNARHILCNVLSNLSHVANHGGLLKLSISLFKLFLAAKAQTGCRFDLLDHLLYLRLLHKDQFSLLGVDALT